MNIRLLVLDLDRTIVCNSNKISQGVKDVVKEVSNRGIEVVLATGRMYRSAKLFHEYLELNTPIIAYNGAWLQNPQTDEILKYQPVCPIVAHELIDFYEQSHLLGEVDVHLYHDDELYVREVTANTLLYSKRSQTLPKTIEDLRIISTLSPTKVLAFSTNTELIQKTTQELLQVFPREKINISQSSKTLIEANHPQASKGKTVGYLCEKNFGFTWDQVMAIGDNFNDLELLEYASIGVAMGDAPATVQAAAQWVAPSVEDDGAVIAIRKFLL